MLNSLKKTRTEIINVIRDTVFYTWRSRMCWSMEGWNARVYRI